VCATSVCRIALCSSFLSDFVGWGVAFRAGITDRQAYVQESGYGASAPESLNSWAGSIIRGGCPSVAEATVDLNAFLYGLKARTLHYRGSCGVSRTGVSQAASGRIPWRWAAVTVSSECLAGVWRVLFGRVWSGNSRFPSGNDRQKSKGKGRFPLMGNDRQKGKSKGRGNCIRYYRMRATTS